MRYVQISNMSSQKKLSVKNLPINKFTYFRSDVFKSKVWQNKKNRVINMSKNTNVKISQTNFFDLKSNNKKYARSCKKNWFDQTLL